ncbi:phenylacetate--CoA ligase family protein [Hymenobacter rigui]|uniref:CoF synthetase n=1 Tax=Hymenobacter rigui TaxID=334424 RepID=A0A428KKM6_9BACT|nr:CoF synthetase [Hymenobacter rigui]RSK46996.1 CoF synthetase [Hymenobacter rigui]
MKTLVLLLTVNILRGWRRLLEIHDGSMRLLYLPGMESWRWNIGKWKAGFVFWRAAHRTPAYQQFLAHHGVQGLPWRGLVPDVAALPIMDKENYVKAYPLAARCLGGAVPVGGVIIDESSGSSGAATNWARSRAERRANKRMLEFGLHSLLGPGPHFILNAFAMGPWATGVNITMALTDISTLKSLGPDVPKIVNTLREFGPGHQYVIMGYPPFLKLLVDSAGLDWFQYQVTMIYGGEGMSEKMRTYLLNRGIRRVYGSLGASDLELNLAAENDFTIALRRELLVNEALAARLVKYPGALPVLFQFNPADFHMESTATDELVITLCRPTYLSPKIRYNLHDRGHIIRFPELKRHLAAVGLTPHDLCPTHTDLPLLLHYGRADMTVAYFGCKLTPADVQEAILGLPLLAGIVSSFTLLTPEDDNATKQLRVCLEIREALLATDLPELQTAFFAELRRLNQDFRESWRMIPQGQQPQLQVFATGTGPFAGQDMRIKHRYIQPPATPYYPKSA